jgi:hypothetical protein
MGGSVSYDYELDDAERYIRDAKPTVPEWLRDLFDRVVAVDLIAAQSAT